LRQHWRKFRASVHQTRAVGENDVRLFFASRRTCLRWIGRASSAGRVYAASNGMTSFDGPGYGGY